MAVNDRIHLEELTRFGRELIVRLGKEALSYYGKSASNTKFDESLVTAAELHLTNFFQQQLRANYPEHQIFNINRNDMAYSHEEKRYLWIFDPIDGVDNFQTGIPIWGSSLALLENFWPVFSIFYMPATDNIYHAVAGGNIHTPDIFHCHPKNEKIGKIA